MLDRAEQVPVDREGKGNVPEAADASLQGLAPAGIALLSEGHGVEGAVAEGVVEEVGGGFPAEGLLEEEDDLAYGELGFAGDAEDGGGDSPPPEARMGLQRPMTLRWKWRLMVVSKGKD